MLLLSGLAIVGAFAIVAWVWENLRTPFLLVWGYLRQVLAQESASLTERYGKWAVVTGASDGIGRGYALELARLGMNVALVSRTESKLLRVEEEIKSQYAVQTKCIVVDFARGEQVYEQLANSLRSLEVGILVNNVGVFHDHPMCLDEVPPKVMWNMINVNVGATTAMSRMLIPQMKLRKKGLIINMSSLSAVLPGAYMTIYACTKTYILQFSLALQEELRTFNVQCQAIFPGLVATKLTEFLSTDAKDTVWQYLVVKFDSFMSYAMFTVGKTNLTTGHWTFGLGLTIIGLLPRFIVERSMSYCYRRVGEATVEGRAKAS